VRGEREGNPNEKKFALSAALGLQVIQRINPCFTELRFREAWTPLLNPIFNRHRTKPLFGSRESALAY
jgi:hypothetical protein